ncbi:MAG: methyl-accepting chemotaxis protein [bacterium]|nr:methyl-accepting chemotaxis protein [bacterium]
MFVIMCLNSFVLLRFEGNREETFVSEYQKKLIQSIDEREASQKTALRKNVAFNAEILTKIGATHLYGIEKQDVQEMLRSYLNYPEILAITVLDDFAEPFAAIWKVPNTAEIHEGNSLPDDLTLNADLSIQLSSLYEGNNVGSFEVFYTDRLLIEEITAAKERASTEVEAFQAASRSRFIRTAMNQIVGGALMMLALIICQIVSLKALIFTPLLTVSQIARQLSQFDLTVLVNSRRRDEVGQLFIAIQEMIQSFRNIVDQVQHSGTQVTSSATELAATAKQQEITVKTQVESTNDVVKSVEEISQVASELVDTMQHVASMSQETAELASSGQTDLVQMKMEIDQMADAAQSISGRLETIHEKAENITTVVTTINKVSDQTNLLSLNAAIEAEKAGEYGRGFTVVAREIRRLADQTASATLDIEEMVQEMQAAVSAGVIEMNKFIAEVRHSVGVAEKIRRQQTTIIEQVQALSPNFEDVSVAMRRQSDHAQKINLTIMDLSEEMRQTKESLSETYSAIEQLNNAARNLHTEVSSFKT